MLALGDKADVVASLFGLPEVAGGDVDSAFGPLLFGAKFDFRVEALIINELLQQGQL